MNTALMIQNARLVHTTGSAHVDDSVSTLYIQNGQITGINQKPTDFPADAQSIDANHQLISFALADLAVHLS